VAQASNKNTTKKKIRSAQLSKYNVMLVVGDNEVMNKNFEIRILDHQTQA
jgi:threonyl-tRNA synthetase